MSDDIVKRFTVRAEWMNRRLPQMLEATGTLNSRKIRRTRRSGLMLVSFNGETRNDGTCVVSVTMRKAPQMGVAAAYKNGREVRRLLICPYAHVNIGKLLKDLTVAQAKLARMAPCA